MTNAEFTTAYLDAMGWKDSVVADENLSVEYPACVYTFSDRRVTALVPEAMCLRKEIPEGAALTEVLGVLVDLEAVRVQREKVIGLFAQFPQIGETLPPVSDGDALERLLGAMEEPDRMRGEVTLQDDVTCCISGEDGELLAAAGAVCSGKIADISVAVHPAVRAKGLGTRVAAALIRKVQEQGYIALYRVEKVNLPSVRLARRLGLRPGFVMEGARILFPEECVPATF